MDWMQWTWGRRQKTRLLTDSTDGKYVFFYCVTPCFINAVPICHITLFSCDSNMVRATVTFNISVKKRLKVQHVNCIIFME